MQYNMIEHLEWDSDFFGYPVSRVYLNNEGKNNIDELFRQLDAEKYRLCYIFISPCEEEVINSISNKGCQLVDQKLLYIKTAEKQSIIPQNVTEFSGQEITRDLVTLALISGSFSRFKFDENFTNDEFQKLYTTWLLKSIDKTIAFKTLVVRNESEYIGLITLGQNGRKGEIGIAAVDENFRSKGIAYDLCYAAENEFFNQGFKEIEVTTQKRNIPACRLFEKCGFSIKEVTNVYHYWQK